jgi:hypothetical protein
VPDKVIDGSLFKDPKSPVAPDKLCDILFLRFPEGLIFPVLTAMTFLTSTPTEATEPVKLMKPVL